MNKICMHKFLILTFLSILLVSACKSTKEFTGFSYDPPNVTDTTDREINPQKNRVIGIGSPKVWISNEFEGARVNDFYQSPDGAFQVDILPENAPINNSPWFAFKIWSEQPQTVQLRLAYPTSRNRYIPKITDENGTPMPIDMEEAEYDSATGSLTFELNLTDEATLVSAQKVTDSDYFDNWFTQITQANDVRQRVIGQSKQGRDLHEFTITNSSLNHPKGVLIILSRQHPPEVAGYLTAEHFIKYIATDNSELTQLFRDHFVTLAYPLINPDGVMNGHWRHNAAGVDLNRDWVNFNQPETKAVTDAILHSTQDSTLQVYYGIDFHSTNENIFYPINEEVVTRPDNVTQRWAIEVIKDNPDILFVSEEFDTSSPISKNWIYRTFGADAVTFEVHDELSHDQVESMAVSAAKSLMQLLLREKGLDITEN